MKKLNLFVAIFSLLVDLLAVVVALTIAYNLRSGGEDLYFWPFSQYLAFILWTLPLWAISFASQRLYNARRLPRGFEALGKTLIGLIAGWGMILIILYLWRSPQAQAFPRLIIVYGIGLTTLLVAAEKILINVAITAFNRAGIGTLQTVIIGNGESDQFADAVGRSPKNGRRLVARFSRDEWPKKLEAFYRATPFDELFVTKSSLPEEELLQLLNWAEDHNVAFTAVPSLLSVRATNVEVSSLAGTPVLYFRRTPLEGWGRVYKRILDLLIVVPAMIILSPLLLLLFILSQLATGRGIIAQERVGQDGHHFRVHKFRSMYVDADERFPEFKGWSTDESKDPRITKVGRILRKTNLDELAQLWDILVGQMSLVGPRPEQPKYVEKFSKEIPAYLKRHRVKTGLTGWAQVNGLRGDTSIAERVKYDLYYIENWSVWFDLRIIIATFIMTLRDLLKLGR